MNGPTRLEFRRPICHSGRSKENTMAGKISKNARREGAHELTSRWGGKIVMKSVFENGRMRHYAYCEKTKNQGRRPRDLM